MSIALDQAVVLSANDGGVGDNPAAFSSAAVVASVAHVFLWIIAELAPTSVTVGGTAATKARDHQNTDWSSHWYVYKPGGMAAASTISVGFAAVPNYCACLASSFTGVKTTSPLDQVNSKSASVNTNWSSSSITPTGSPSVVFGFYSSDGADSRSTPGSGWTELHDVNHFNNLVVQYQIVSDLTARDPSGTFASGQNPSPTQRGITSNFLDAAVAAATAFPGAAERRTSRRSTRLRI